MAEKTQLTPEEKDRARRLKWFREARFGMFIHWGLYAQIGRHEWAMNLERIPVEDYEKLAQTWKPKRGCQRQWAKLAKSTGMRYMVMTTKHHEGFCLWDSKVCDYNAARHGPGRDLVAEYVEACRAEGLKVGLYYSLQDWHHPDSLKGLKDEKARRRFIDFTHGLVEELMTNYGKIDILWYDCPHPYTTPEQWESEKMNAMVRRLQPDIIINNRTRLPEDFGTPEQHITPEQGGRMWEACMTMNDSWGYTPIDVNYKSAWQVVGMLRQVAAGGGNLLLNIGPAPDGSLPPIYRKVFGEVGEWLKQYGPSVYEATDPMKQGWQITGAFTRKGSTVYFHCNRWPGKELAIGGLQNKVLEARLMGGPEIAFSQSGERLVLTGLPEKAPNKAATVIELKVRGVPVHKTSHSVADLPWD
jgi:alpha-L-fucosidase